ncbi:MAG: bifunctional metallophosphatase/5'-nucleotidase [Burkholderiales bacterium]|nr:MAG: bifunctional metallophosphatase/5'-nucleotidase [Burkholderiales bacterium]
MNLKQAFLSCCCALLLACAGFASAQDLKVTLLHVNDVYQVGAVDKGKRGGLARLATLKAKLREDSPHTLLILGGDTLSPSVASNTFKGAQMIAGWNAAGLDLAVLGNHEFDFGPQVLRERLAESQFTWITANVFERKNGKRFAGLRGSVLRELGGVKVGFIGVITPDTAQTSKPGPGLRFTDPYIAVRQEAARLRARGAQAVVALTHLDIEADRRLAALGVVDLILGGHDHSVMQSLAGRTPVFKAGSDARFALRVDLVFDARRRRFKHLDWELLPVDAAIPDHPATAGVVAKYEAELAARLDFPVGDTAVELDARQVNNRSRETNLGSWLAEIYRASTQAEVAIVNGGSIRSNTTYGPGKLTKRDILTILPFENPIVKLEVPGRVLRQVLEHGVAEMHASQESGRFPQVAGLRFAYDARRPTGQRVVEIAVNGAALEDERRYALAVNLYLATGGDGYPLYRDLRYLLSPENALSETAEVIEALAKSGQIAPQIDGRIKRLD